VLVPTFQQGIDSKPDRLADFGGDLTSAAADVKSARRKYTSGIDKFRGRDGSAKWRGEDSEALAREVDRLARTVNTNRVMTEAAGNATKTLGESMNATVEAMEQTKKGAERAGFRVLPTPFVMPGPRHYQQASSAGPAGPGIIAAYWSIAATLTVALGTQLAALNAQDMGGAAQLQGFAMSLGTTDVLSINTPIGEYVPGGTPQSTSDLARKAVDSFCEQQDLPKSEFDPRTTAAMVDPNGNITYGPSVRHQRINDPAVQEALDNVPRGERSPSHGHCAEIGALNEARPSVNDVRGSTIATMKNRGPNSEEYRQPHAPCGSCSSVLSQFGVNYAG
jgi:hypothetical protein